MNNKEVKYYLEEGNFSKVLKILEENPSNMNVNEVYDTGLTPLHLACSGGALELTIELVAQGADLFVPCQKTGNLPLHFACANNHKAIVEFLLRSGADRSVPNMEGKIPVELTSNTAIRQSLTSINWLTQQNSKSLVDSASLTSRPQPLEKSQAAFNSEHPVPSDVLNPQLSAEKEQDDLNISIETLTINRSDQCNKLGPAYRAPVLPRLLEYATWCHEDAKYQNQRYNDANLTRKILEAVASTADSLTSMRLEYLHRSDVFKACTRENLSDAMATNLEKLLDHKPELVICRAVDIGYASDGWTPLHCAAKNGSVRAAKILLRKDSAACWQCDLIGRLPLHIAAKHLKKDMCKLLLSIMQRSDDAAVLNDQNDDKKEEETSLSTPPRNSVSLLGTNAPQDASGTTPLGSATREANGKPSPEIVDILYRRGDSSVFSVSPFKLRSGRTPLKRGWNGSRLQSISESASNSLSQHAMVSMSMFFAHSEAQGWRGEMEDQCITRCPLLADSNDGDALWCLYGVLDGHGGDFTSRFVNSILPDLISEKLFDKDIDEANVDAVKSCLEESFIDMDSRLAREARMAVWSKEQSGKSSQFCSLDKSGSTACLCLIGPSVLLTANLGDSRGVLGRAPGSAVEAVEMSHDHKPGLQEESRRIQEAGCSVTLVKGTTDVYEITSPLDKQVLRVSRAFGDFRFKWAKNEGEGGEEPTTCFRELSPRHQAVTCVPEVLAHLRSECDMFVILACDGVWDVFSSKEAVEFVSNSFRNRLEMHSKLRNDTVAEVADDLVQACLDRGSMDNISVVLVAFPYLEEYFVPTNAEQSEDLHLERSLCPDEAADITDDMAQTQNAGTSPDDTNLVHTEMSESVASSPMKGTKLF